MRDARRMHNSTHALYQLVRATQAGGIKSVHVLHQQVRATPDQGGDSCVRISLRVRYNPNPIRRAFGAKVPIKCAHATIPSSLGGNSTCVCKGKIDACSMESSPEA